MYSPNGDYEGKSQEYQIGSVTATLHNHHSGEPTEITLEGLNIWGVAASQDGGFIRACMSAKTKEECSTIKNVTNSLNSLSPDVALEVLRLSLQPRLQYHQQTHSHDFLQDTNQVVQRALGKAVTQIFGFNPRSSEAYTKDPATLPDPSIMRDLIALPVSTKA